MLAEAMAFDQGMEDSQSSLSVSQSTVSRRSPVAWTVGESEAMEDVQEEETDDGIVFSKWVFSAVKSSFLSMDVFKTGDRHLTDEHKEDEKDIDLWLKYKIASTSDKKLKKIVRRRVPPTVRARLWQEVSGGTTLMSRTPNLYQETSEKVFGKGKNIDNFEDVPPCPLSNETGFMSYYLKPEGVLALKKILYVLSCLHPDITYCPLLQPVAALFLHFMDEVWCFACMSSLLSSKKDYFDQTQAKATIADAAFQDCAKMVMKKEMKMLRKYLLNDENIPEDKLILFPSWQSTIFQHLDFTLLVRLVDCFVVEGQKVIYRIGLLLLQLFYEYSLSYERIGCPTPHDLILAIGQYSEALTVTPNDFIKVSLKVKVKTKQIKQAIEANSTLVKDKRLEVSKDIETDSLIAFDINKMSDIITLQQWQTLISWLPNRIALQQPFRLFSTDEDGYSLQTLYNKSEEEEQSLLIVKTTQKEIFGAYLSAGLRERKQVAKALTPFGTGETFLFCVEPVPRCFYWSSVDRTDSKPTMISRKVSSYIFVDFKPVSPGQKRKRSVRKISNALPRRKLSTRVSGIPHTVSARDLEHKNVGGVRKNSSVIALREFAKSQHMETSSTSSERSPSPGSHMPDHSANNSTDHHGDRHIIDGFSLHQKRIELDDEHDETDSPAELDKVKHTPSDIFIACDDKCISVGGGGGYGLWLDQALDRGRSEVCNTFRNRPLTSAPHGDFKCSRVEVFGFRDPEL